MGVTGRLLPEALKSLELDVAGKAADHRLRVAERDIRRIVVARVEDRLHRGGVRADEVLREVVGHDDGHLATARVHRSLNGIVVALCLRPPAEPLVDPLELLIEEVTRLSLRGLDGFEPERG